MEPLKSPVKPGELLAAWLKRNRGRFATDALFAAAIGCTAARLSQLLAGLCGAPKPGLAIAIHRETRGQVSAHLWRPDLWSRRSAVPLAAALAPQ
jgi:DNA-binding transcriptional regulator YdaS (Cro superfamily)